MNFRKLKVYHLFWITSLIIILIGIINTESTVDINIHDTYFVIAHFYFAAIFSLLFFLMGLGYWLIQKVHKRELVKYLTVIHTFILIGSFAFYWLVMFYCRLFPQDAAFPLFDNYQLINIVITTELLLVIFIATPIYIINLLIGMFRKNK